MSQNDGKRIGLIGPYSLLGRELAKVLKERDFPVRSAVTIEAGHRIPEIPVLDVDTEVLESVQLEELSRGNFDIIFLVDPLGPADWDMFATRLQDAGSSRPQAAGPVIIGLAEFPQQADGAFLPAPGSTPAVPVPAGPGGSRLVRSPHAASVVLSTLLLRLESHFHVTRAVAHVFTPASTMGPQAIEELQEQILGLMSFQKIPKAVFGTQVAFNILPRLGRPARSVLPALEDRIRQELSLLTGNRVLSPAVRLLQAPVFFATAFSIYIETEEKPDAARAANAIEGAGVEVRKANQPAASQVSAASSADILVDVVTQDVSGHSGLWIWAAVDDLHLAARSAVEIAERLIKKETLH